MFFNTTDFLIFFIIVYSLYLVLTHKWQNRMLLIASYFFYGYWDWRFLSLLWISTIVDFFSGRKIFEIKNEKGKKLFLALSILCNLGMLGFFKYFGFFLDSAVDLLNAMGLDAHPSSLRIILPIGISFYTFQTMSYSIDIYRGKLKPTDNFIDFALFVSFFPQLVAGPIERATNLLPKISNHRHLNPDQIKEGVFLITWGLFKKIMIADNIAWIVNTTFGNYQTAGSLEILIALYAFSIQVYCDFSGYSDIARGLANVMGFDLMVNFRLPYFATNMSDFWRRWHISLTSWLRDYLFITIGGSHKGITRTCINTIFVLTIVGLWHGANWTFIIWGFYFGVVQAVYIVIKPYIDSIFSNLADNWRKLVSILGAILVFHIVTFNVIFFRAQSVSQSLEMIANLFLAAPSSPQIFQMSVQLLFFSLPLIIMQIAQARSGDLLFFIRLNGLQRFSWTCAGLIFIALMHIYGAHLITGEEFIYFQF